MIEKFVAFQWKALNFTVWENQTYKYLEINNKPVSILMTLNMINTKNTRFKLNLLG
jgi:hypothetical protein